MKASRNPAGWPMAAPCLVALTVIVTVPATDTGAAKITPSSSLGVPRMSSPLAAAFGCPVGSASTIAPKLKPEMIEWLAAVVVFVGYGEGASP